MKRREILPPDIFIEPERYELHAAPTYQFDLSRRNFFKWLGSGIVVVLLIEEALAQESGRRGSGRGRPSDIGAWLHIGEDGVVTVYTGKVEVGQNSRTALTQVVAEELRVPMTAVRMVMADTQLVPFDAGTFGSQTTPSMSPQLRRVAAAAREALIDLAAEQWKAERATLVASDGKISDKQNNRAIDYGKLAKGQKLTHAVAEDSSLTPPSEWKIAGHPATKVNGKELVTGKHRYASDQNLPDMLHGKILRPAAFGATLESLDTKAAEAMDGVTVVHDGDFVGVTAPNELLATRAITAIKAEWKTSPQISNAELFDELKKPSSGNQRGGGGGRSGGPSSVGSIEDGLAAADVKLRATYNISYIAHAPLEPRAAVAKWDGDKLIVWTGTQRPFGVRGDLAQAFRMPEGNVRVIVPDTGAGYGGKHTNDAATEAARLAKAAKRPVKLVWTREEEFTWAYFRPAGVIEVSSGARKNGALTAWEFHNYNSGASALRTLYDVPNQRHEFHSARSPLKQGSYRALAATANHFARESHMDELARELKIDPIEFRRKNLKDARLRAVLDAAAEKFGWGKQERAKYHGRGIACGSEKGSFIATCAEIFADRKTGKVKVLRVVAAFECGAIINPDQLKNQIEGSIVMGLGGALFEAIQFANGKILNPHFADYRVPRFSDVPQIEVVLLDRKDIKSLGAGETPIVCIAPAVGNAIADATGVRLRSMPMIPDGLKI